MADKEHLVDLESAKEQGRPGAAPYRVELFNATQNAILLIEEAIEHERTLELTDARIKERR
jgi:hypothetical protein